MVENNRECERERKRVCVCVCVCVAQRSIMCCSVLQCVAVCWLVSPLYLSARTHTHTPHTHTHTQGAKMEAMEKKEKNVVGGDLEAIVEAFNATLAAAPRQPGNVVGTIKNLQSGKFKDAAGSLVCVCCSVLCCSFLCCNVVGTIRNLQSGKFRVAAGTLVCVLPDSLALFLQSALSCSV